MFSRVTRFLTKVIPFSIQGRRASSLESKSMMVIFLVGILTWSISTGMEQRATAPKPTNKTRFLNSIMDGS